MRHDPDFDFWSKFMVGLNLKSNSKGRGLRTEAVQIVGQSHGFGKGRDRTEVFLDDAN